MNAEVRQQAAEWLIKFRTDEPAAVTRGQFADWLRVSPEHVRAYLELVALWEDAGRYDSQHNVEVESLIALARADTTVVPLEVAEHVSVPGVVHANNPVEIRAARRGFGLAAMMACFAIAAGGAGWYALHQDADYITDVGEQRTIKLADGSVAELNAVSRIRVHFSDRERTIELLGGQALFRVAQNKTRPFVVITGDTHVRAVGTEFDVNRKRAGTVVTVLEGRVAVSDPSQDSQDAASSPSAPRSVEVAAGEAVTLTGKTLSHKQAVNVAAATAWTQQQLTFDSTPLPEVAEEFNRFNTRRLVVGGNGLSTFRVSGTFPALDPASLPRFVLFLRNQRGLQVDESNSRIVVTEK